jgi:DNA-binding CsgD family transcriptional regulator
VGSALQTDRALLELCPGGALLLAPTGHIVSANKAAQHLLHNHPALFEKNGHIIIRRVHEARLFAEALAETCAKRCPSLVILRKREGAPILAISLSPAPDEHHTLAVIADLYAKLAIEADDLRALFGFTLAEARIATALANGATATTMATDLGISITTVRSHLRTLMQKSGAASQSRLIAVLLRAESLRAGRQTLP